jgi:S-adenosylmethionine hydrolase
MSIITLISDFGVKDHTVSAIKGSILDQIDQPVIVDITHDVTPYNILEAGFIINAAYPNFPERSIHLIGIDSAYTPEQKHLLAKLNNHYFIAADNGIFSLLAKRSQYSQLIEIEHPKSVTSNFPMRDVFVDIAAQIVFGEQLENLGTPIDRFNIWKQNEPNIAKENEIIGHIVYIDNFGNLITDITQDIFNTFCSHCKFEIIASSAKINKIYPTYSSFIKYDIEENQRMKAGKALAIFNSLGFLEIALYKSNPNHGGSAASLLGMQIGDSIQITRY